MQNILLSLYSLTSKVKKKKSAIIMSMSICFNLISLINAEYAEDFNQILRRCKFSTSSSLI